MRTRAPAENRSLLLALTLAVVVWAASLVLAPYVARLSGVGGGILYAVGSLICHQRPERSFYLAGAQLPVCARCQGLYLGAAAGALVWTFVAKRRPHAWRRARALTVLTTAALPTALTVATAILGVGDPPNAWRFTLAIPLGLVGGMVVGAVASEHLK